MTILSTIFFSTAMLITSLGGWRLYLRSLCASDHWRMEVKQQTARLKRQRIPSWRAGTTSCYGSTVHWEFEGKFAKGQEGSVELLGAGLLLAFTLAIMLMVGLWSRRHAQVQEHLKQTLCLKAAMLETNLLVKRINRVNAVIAKGEVTSWSLILLGGIGLVLKPEWEKVKKGLQLFQELQWGYGQKEFLKLKQQGCKLPLALWPSPYHWQGSLARGIDGRALMRGQQSLWVMSTPLTTHWARWKSTSDLSPTLSWEMR